VQQPSRSLGAPEQGHIAHLASVDVHEPVLVVFIHLQQDVDDVVQSPQNNTSEPLVLQDVVVA
jgi:hypothetical protein